jgi:hypothetical protein
MAFNTNLNRLGQIGVHRQADDLGGDPLGRGQPVSGERKILVGCLPMQGLRIINGCWDACGLEVGLERLAVEARKPQRVLRPHRVASAKTSGTIATSPRRSL